MNNTALSIDVRWLHTWGLKKTLFDSRKTEKVVTGKSSGVFDSFIFNMEEIKMLTFLEDTEMSKPEKRFK